MWTIQYLLSISSFLLGIFLISQVLRQRRAPGSTLAWLLTIILVPHIGIPLYIFLGFRKIRSPQWEKRAVYAPVPYPLTPSAVTSSERLLLASGVPNPSSGNQLAFLDTGETAFKVLMELIRGARKQIHITTFILKLDPVGKEIMAALEAKARSGVQVRLLLDGFGSFWTLKFRLKSFIRAGGRMSFFLPIIHIPFFGHSNLRNHRKLVLVDGRDGILGGMNLAREYMGSDHYRQRWVDLSVHVCGPGVQDLEALFIEDWEFAAKEKLPPRTDIPLDLPGSETVQVVASGPDVPGDPLYDSIASAIFAAKTRVWIATPYFIPDETLSKALEIAAKKGVDVKIILPKRSNHPLTDLCRGSYLRQVERAGGHIFYFPDKMMHGKAIIIDDLFAIVGSANFDMRSLLLNYELGLFLYSADSLIKISHWFEALRKRCVQEPLQQGWYSDFVEGIGRILGPML
ncbi:MAG: phospholipase D-like domain-containing protein [Oligoflexia bacterium]|nr:phospholipase D-like domain-containing protein [Oligoflexia bacterium]